MRLRAKSQCVTPCQDFWNTHAPKIGSRGNSLAALWTFQEIKWMKVKKPGLQQIKIINDFQRVSGIDFSVEHHNLRHLRTWRIIPLGQS